MWSKTSHVVYIDTRRLFLKVMAVILTIMMIFTYWNWTRVTEIKFASHELEAEWRINHPEIIGQIKSGLRKSKTITGVGTPSSGIVISLYSRKEVRDYLWDGSRYLLDKKTGKVIELDSNLKAYFEIAAREIKKRSPFGEIVDWKEVKELFHIGSKAEIKDIDTGIQFTVTRTGGYSHADVEPLKMDDTLKLKAIYNGTLNWKRKAVVVQVKGRKIAASLTGAPHGHGKNNNNELYGKVGLYFSDKETNRGINISHQMMIWKAAGRTVKYLKKMSPEETIIAIFTAIDQRDLKSLRIMLKHPIELKANELEQIIGVTVTGIKKETFLNYDVIVSVSLTKGPYNEKRLVRLQLYKDALKGCYVADKRFLEKILDSMSKKVNP